MLSLQRSEDEFRLIRVLLVPLGVNSLFEEQFLRLSKLQELNLFDLNRPSNNDKNRHAHFKYMNWNNGKLLVEYLRYDHACSGATEFEDFMACKRICIVIGLLNHEEYKSANDSTVDGELDRFAKRYPSVLLKKIFVFNFNFDANSPLDATLTRRVQSKQASNRPSDDVLSIFPPDAPCEGGSMVDVHFKQVMSQLLSALFMKLEHMMDICEDARLRNILPQTPSLITIHDDLRDEGASTHAPSAAASNKGGQPSLSRPSTSSAQAVTSAARVNQQMFRKKPLGRLHKWMGDLSLLVCSPLDAIEHYAISIAEFRYLGDSLWLAGALEGYSAAVLLLHDMGGFDLEECIGKDLKTVKQPPPMDPLDDDYDNEEDSNEEGDGGQRSETRPAAKKKKKKEVTAVFLLAEDRATEALSLYSSSSFFHLLEVECCFRLAKLLVRVNNYPNRQFKTLQLVLRGVTVPGLNSRQQLEAVLQGVLVLRALGGLERKMALLMYIGGLMAAEQGSFIVASRLMEDVSRHFGWTRHNNNAGSDSFLSSSRGWPSLASTVLTDIICIVDEKDKEVKPSPSIALQQQTSASTYLTHLLCVYGEREEAHAIVKTTLARYNHRLLGLDKLPRVRPPQPPSGATASLQQQQQSNRNSTTMMTPVKGLNEETLRKLDNNQLPPAVPSPAAATVGGRRLLSASEPSTAALQLQARQAFRPQISPNPLAKGTSNRPPVDDHHHSITDRIVAAGSITGGGQMTIRSLTVSHHSHLGGGSGGAVATVSKGGKSSVGPLSSKSSSTINQLGDRLKRSLATAANALDSLDINLFDDNNSSGVLPSATDSSTILMTASQREAIQQLQQPLYRSVELAVARDILQFVTKQLAAQVIPVELQEAALAMLLTNASSGQSMTMNGWQRKAFSSILQRLPVLVLGCQPLLCSASALPSTFNAKHVATEIQTAATALSASSAYASGSRGLEQAKAPPALFYDPFAARRGREQHRAMQLAEPAKWPLQQIQHLLVKLYNPLAVALPLRLCPVLSGASHTAHEVEIELAAYAEAYVELPVIIHTTGTCKLEAIYVSFAAGSTVSELQQRVEIDAKGLTTLYQRKECSRHYRSHVKGEDRFKLDKDRNVIASNEILAVTTTVHVFDLPQANTAVKLFPCEHRKERLSFSLDGTDNDAAWHAVDIQLKSGSNVVMPFQFLRASNITSPIIGAKMTVGNFLLNVSCELTKCEDAIGTNGKGKIINLELQFNLESITASNSAITDDATNVHREVVFDLEIVGLDEKQFQAAQLLSAYKSLKLKEGRLTPEQSSQLISFSSEIVADAWSSLPSRTVSVCMDFTIALPGITAVNRGSLGGLSSAEEQRLRSLLISCTQGRSTASPSSAVSPILWMGTDTLIKQQHVLIHNQTNLAVLIVAGSIEQAASATATELEGQVMLRLPANTSKPLILPSKSQDLKPVIIPELFWAAVETNAKVARVGRLITVSSRPSTSHISSTPFSVLSVRAGDLSGKSLRVAIGQRWRVTCSVQLLSKPLQANMVELVVLIDERYAEFYGSSSSADKNNEGLGVPTSSKGYLISGKLRTLLKTSTTAEVANETMGHTITLCCLRPGFYDISVLARPHFTEEDGGNDPAEPWWVVAEKLTVEAILS